MNYKKVIAEANMHKLPAIARKLEIAAVTNSVTPEEFSELCESFVLRMAQIAFNQRIKEKLGVIVPGEELIKEGKEWNLIDITSDLNLKAGSKVVCVKTNYKNMTIGKTYTLRSDMDVRNHIAVTDDKGNTFFKMPLEDFKYCII